MNCKGSFLFMHFNVEHWNEQNYIPQNSINSCLWPDTRYLCEYQVMRVVRQLHKLCYYKLLYILGMKFQIKKKKFGLDGWQLSPLWCLTRVFSIWSTHCSKYCALTMTIDRHSCGTITHSKSFILSIAKNCHGIGLYLVYNCNFLNCKEAWS